MMLSLGTEDSKSSDDSAEVKALKERITELEKVKRDLAKLTVELRKVGREYRDKAAALDAEKNANGGHFPGHIEGMIKKDVHEAALEAKEATIKDLKAQLHTARNELAAAKDVHEATIAAKEDTIKELKYRLQTTQTDLNTLKSKTKKAGSNFGYHSPTRVDDDVVIISEADLRAEELAKKEEELVQLQVQVQTVLHENTKLTGRIKELESTKKNVNEGAGTGVGGMPGMGGGLWPFQSPFMLREKGVSTALLGAKDKEIETLQHRIRELKKGLEDSWTKGNALEKEHTELKHKLDVTEREKSSLKEVIEAGQRSVREAYKVMKCSTVADTPSLDAARSVASGKKQTPTVNGGERSAIAHSPEHPASKVTATEGRATTEDTGTIQPTSYFGEKPKLLDSGPEDRAVTRKRGVEVSSGGSQKRFRSSLSSELRTMEETSPAEQSSLWSPGGEPASGTSGKRSTSPAKRTSLESFTGEDSTPVGRLRSGVGVSPFMRNSSNLSIGESVTHSKRSPGITLDLSNTSGGVAQQMVDDAMEEEEEEVEQMEEIEQKEMIRAQLDALLSQTRKNMAIALYHETLIFDRRRSGDEKPTNVTTTSSTATTTATEMATLNPTMQLPAAEEKQMKTVKEGTEKRELRTTSMSTAALAVTGGAGQSKGCATTGVQVVVEPASAVTSAADQKVPEEAEGNMIGEKKKKKKAEVFGMPSSGWIDIGHMDISTTEGSSSAEVPIVLETVVQMAPNATADSGQNADVFVMVEDVMEVDSTAKDGSERQKTPEKNADKQGTEKQGGSKDATEQDKSADMVEEQDKVEDETIFLEDVAADSEDVIIEDDGGVDVVLKEKVTEEERPAVDENATKPVAPEASGTVADDEGSSMLIVEDEFLEEKDTLDEFLDERGDEEDAIEAAILGDPRSTSVEQCVVIVDEVSSILEDSESQNPQSTAQTAEPTAPANVTENTDAHGQST